MYAPALGNRGDIISHCPVRPSSAQSLFLERRQLARRQLAAVDGEVNKILWDPRHH